MSSTDHPVSVEDVDLKPQAERIKELERSLKKTKYFAIFFFVVAFLAIVAIVALVVNDVGIDDDDDDDNNHSANSNNAKAAESAPQCGAVPSDLKSPPEFLLGDPESEADLHVFHSLTVTEIKAVRDYLATSINLTRPSEDDNLAMAKVHGMDVELPNKEDVLYYLDHENEGAQKPPRRARVIVHRGDLDPPIVQELVCGPLPEIEGCDVHKEVPFALRAIHKMDFSMMEEHLIPEIHRQFGHIIRESFNASFDLENCEDDCLNWWETPVGDGISGAAPYRRQVWIHPRYSLPYYVMFPIDMGFLVDIDGVDETKWKVDQVWYSGALYDDLDNFVAAYDADTIPKTKLDRPRGKDATYASMESRLSEQEKSERHQRPPQLVEPDGKRYTVRHGKIEYLGLWSLYYRIDPMHGPALYDIRFKNERIVYELSLMEIIVQYTGFAPMVRQCQFVDTVYNMGTSGKVVFPGADCPSTATLLPWVTSAHDSYEPAVFTQGSCVFEENSGRSLRRHHSFGAENGGYYGGMQDSALIIRTIPVVENYDYVIDFKFHQNGAIEVSSGKTGNIMAVSYTPEEAPYGFEIYKNVYGPAHLHFTHFKVDLDIKNGSSNRYSTLNLVEDTQDILQDSSRTMSSMKMEKILKTTEKEANYKFDFNTPKYHIFYNEQVKNEYGANKAYRLHVTGITPQITKPDSGHERGYAWSRYQMSVTKYKDDEQASSGPYNQWSTVNPEVDFTDFYNDDESIVDQDLVAWVTLGAPHIVHTEDLPVTSTPATYDIFHILPFNYFTECPSMKSTDLTYMGLVDTEVPEEGIYVEIAGAGEVTDPQSFSGCEVQMQNFTAVYDKDPNIAFEATESPGTF